MTDVYDTTNWKRLQDGTPVFARDELYFAVWVTEHYTDPTDRFACWAHRVWFIAESERDQYRCAAHELSEYAARVVGEHNRLTRIVWGVQRALMGGG